jgi:hypothetical protein
MRSADLRFMSGPSPRPSKETFGSDYASLAEKHAETRSPQPPPRVFHVTGTFKDPKDDRSFGHIHHDALEFPDGEIVLLTRLCEGQKATVLTLPPAGQDRCRGGSPTARRLCRLKRRVAGLVIGTSGDTGRLVKNKDHGHGDRRHHIRNHHD